MHRLPTILAFAAAFLVACGGGESPSRSAHVRQALTGSPELLELESVAARQELFREVARTSLGEAGRPAQQPVLFPVSRGAELVAAAPGFDARVDLLQGAPVALQLTFDTRGGERWPEDRRDSLQGLSEREAAELVARSLLQHWGIHPAGAVQVDRASGAPYAVAYVDGILRVNPSFLYLAASAPPAVNGAP
jgi:hypothetical protein